MGSELTTHNLPKVRTDNIAQSETNPDNKIKLGPSENLHTSTNNKLNLGESVEPSSPKSGVEQPMKFSTYKNGFDELLIHPSTDNQTNSDANLDTIVEASRPREADNVESHSIEFNSAHTFGRTEHSIGFNSAHTFGKTDGKTDLKKKYTRK